MKRASHLRRIGILAVALAALLTACATDCEACVVPDVGPEALEFRLCLTQAPDSAPTANLCLDVALGYVVTN